MSSIGFQCGSCSLQRADSRQKQLVGTKTENQIFLNIGNLSLNLAGCSQAGDHYFVVFLFIRGSTYFNIRWGLQACSEQKLIISVYPVFHILSSSKKNWICDNVTLVNDQLDAQMLYFIIRLLQSSTCFEQRRAHHQEVKFY